MKRIGKKGRFVLLLVLQILVVLTMVAEISTEISIMYFCVC